MSFRLAFRSPVGPFVTSLSPFQQPLRVALTSASTRFPRSSFSTTHSLKHKHPKMAITHATGYAIHDIKKYTDFKLEEYKLKSEEPHDVTVAVECCGVCGSDHHTISGGWGPLTAPFCVTGHEIVGKVVQVGPEVTEFKVGQRVGVGAQSGSCLKCELCKSGNEQYCPGQVDTYNAKWPNGDFSQGGYSTHVRAQDQFVFAIPDELKSEEVASMLCGGVTSTSPLFRNGITKGSKVGVVGLGGLGHYGVLFAKALGAEVTVFSHSSNKKADAEKMGADHFIITEEGFEKDISMTLDFIVCTSSSSKLPLNQLLTTLKVGSKFCYVGMPDDEWPSLRSQAMASNGAYIGSSHIGSKIEIERMLKLAVEKDVHPWIKVRPMKEAAEAINEIVDGSIRYRTVLTQDIKQ